MTTANMDNTMIDQLDLVRRYNDETRAHVFDVASRLPRGPEGKSLRRVAIFHDWLEDGLGTRDELAQAGLTQREIELVDILARRKDEVYRDYLHRVARDQDAIRVKLVDLASNIERGEREHKGFLLARYRAAKNFLQNSRIL